MIYFDNSATSKYKPIGVIKAVVDTLSNSANGGRGSHKQAIQEAEKTHNARQSVLSLLGAQKDYNCVFTKNCTEALNLAILRNGAKGHIITTMLEHNSVLRPLRWLEKNKGVKVTYLEPDNSGKICLQQLSEAISLETYMIVINHVSNVTGSEQQLEKISAIAEKRGVLLLVDAAQSLGQKQIDMKKIGIDLLCGCGHKGLHSPQGIGFLVYNKRIKLMPLLYGGTGTDSLSLDQPYNPPESLEAGTLNGPAISGLIEGIQWTTEHFSQINQRKQVLSKMILDGLKKIENVKVYTIENNGVISFNIGNTPSTIISDILSEKYDIATRGGIQCAPKAQKWLNTYEQGVVRVSVGYNNTKRDVKKLLMAVSEISKE